MAIPSWLWPENSRSDREIQRDGDSLKASEIENATDVFEALSNTIRLKILASLHNQSVPSSYTELRESASVEDKGKFNYHLRQLEPFVCNREGRYALTQRGENLVQIVLTEDQILQCE